MDQDQHDRAAARLEQAVTERARQDPREPFRAALRRLRERRPDAFQTALRYYEDELVPRVASDADPLAAWLAYGRRLAELSGAGRWVRVAPAGRAEDAAEPSEDGLLLYLPDATDAPVLMVDGPAALTPAQEATRDLLVAGSLGR